MLTLRRFFAYSLLLHTAILIAALSFVPPIKEKRGGEFFARLVSPDEFLVSRPSSPDLGRMRPTPHVRPKAVMPAPARGGHILTLPEREVSPSQSPLPSASPDATMGGRSERKGTVQQPVKPELSTREKLFDKGIIGDLSKRETRKGDREEEERTFTFNVKELKYLPYLLRLKEKIESTWVYPPDALAQGIYGDLVIKFTIKKNGRLEAVELVRTSGHKNLDSAALKALRDAEPFWPLPDEWGVETYTIEGHFIYTIYGYYIR
jgi:protein TonB